MLRTLFAVSFAALLIACPKSGTTATVAGGDDEVIEQLSSQLEEFRTREIQCPEWCTAKAKVCDISKTVCDIAGKSADRADFQKKCVSSQEECAKFSESCATCSAN